VSITVVTIANALKPTERTVERVRPQLLGNWLMQRWPSGPPGNLSVVVNGASVRLEDCERLVLKDADHVLLIVTPAGPAVLPFIVQALISLAISFVVSQIFKPKKPTALVDQPSASPVYSISGSQNAARLGEPIPVGYGDFIQVPDFGSQPYTEFVNHEMYLNEILVIGQGQYQILADAMMVGDSTITSLPDGIVTWQKYDSTTHLQRMGVIEDGGVFSPPLLENVVTSPEVGDQELSSGADVVIPPEHYWRAFGADYTLVDTIAPHYSTVPGGGTDPGYDLAWLVSHPSETLATTYSYVYFRTFDGTNFYYTWVDVTCTTYGPPPYPAHTVIPAGTVYTPPPGSTTVGYFEACKPGQVGDRLMLDFIFPGGLYSANETTGEFEGATVAIDVEYQKIDDNGTPLAAATTLSLSYTEATNNARRYTESIDLTSDPGRYRVRCTRITANATNLKVQDKVNWFGLKFKLVRTPSTQIVYGDTTVVALRIKATNGIASAATSRIRFRVQRQLPILGSGSLVVTSNPADAFVDVMTAAYGARRPLSEVDVPALTLCHDSWEDHNGFNAVIAQRSTVFEALKMVTQVVAAGPLPLGQLMSVEVDSVKESRVAMFTEANLNNCVVGYEFDKVGAPAGVRVEYRDYQSFSAAFVVLPEAETDVDQISLFGCTDRDTAEQYAQLVLNRRELLRKTVSFDTEQEGLLILPGDRIAVQHQMPRWGQVAIVDEVQVAARRAAAPKTTVLVWIQDTLTVDRDPLGTIADRHPEITTTDFYWRASGDTTLEIIDALGASAPGATNDVVQFLTGASPGISGDPYFANVKLLMHCDGADASTTFTDSSPSPQTLSRTGDAQIDTAQSVFGGASVLFDGTGDSVMTPTGATFDLGTISSSTNATFECRVRFASVASEQAIFTHGIPGSGGDGIGGFEIYMSSGGGSLSFGVGKNVNSSPYLARWNTTGGSALAANVWYALAFVIDAGVPRIFVNGGERAGAWTIGGVFQSSFIGLNTTKTGKGLVLGGYGADSTHASVIDPLNGWLDEVRVTMGVCRYGTTFVPADGPFPDNASAAAEPFVPLGINALPWKATVAMQKQTAVTAEMFDFQEWDFFLNAEGDPFIFIVWDQPDEFIGIGISSGGDSVVNAQATTIEGGPGTLTAEMTVAASGVTVVFTFHALEVDPVIETVSFAYDMTAFDDLYAVRVNATSGDGQKIYARFFNVFTEVEGGGGAGPTLILDRGLDWEGTPEPHAVMLSSEVNGVSPPLSCERGDVDHELVLLEPAPFDLFGKGEHQEPTRVAFGTVDNIVRDWIVVSAQPQQGVGVHVEALTYNPDVYIDAMPHQLIEPGTGGEEMLAEGAALFIPLTRLSDEPPPVVSAFSSGFDEGFS